MPLARHLRIMPLWICLRWHEQAATPSQGSLHDVALAMLQYSPQVACFRHDAIVLEVSASLALFGGVRRLCRRVRHSVRALNLPLNLGLAPSASGAWLLAGVPPARHRRTLRIKVLERRLDALPLQALPETAAHARWLDGIGCRSLGQLRALPRQGLQQRTHPELLRALDAAYARAPEPLVGFVPPETFRLAHEPDFHLIRDTAILAATQPLLQALCGWLHQRQQALHDLVLVLHHEKGRHAPAPTRVVLRFSIAAWRLEDFNLILKEQLGRVVLRQTVVRLELISGPALPRAPVSETLFPDPARQAQETRRLLDLLAARLGPESIRRPQARFHHLPERANTWSFGPGAEPCVPPPTAAGSHEPPDPSIRPFWLLPVAQRLDVLHERPRYQGRTLRLVQGPERIETGWNEGTHLRRDYFVAEDPEGARYWVYRERETGEGWFLHGLFA